MMDGRREKTVRKIKRWVVEGQVDTHRKFVVSYYLSDDTILVTQEREQNSGREGGRFLSR